MILLSLFSRQHPDEKGGALLNFLRSQQNPESSAWFFTLSDAAVWHKLLLHCLQIMLGLMRPFVPPTELSRRDSSTTKTHQCQGRRIPSREMWGGCGSFHFIHSSPASYQLYPNPVQEPRARRDSKVTDTEPQNGLGGEGP